MKLLDIISRKATDKDGLIEMVISVDFGNGAETIPFGYQEGDETGLSPDVAAWLADEATVNPIIEDYIAPPITDLIKTAKQQVVQFANEITNSILSQYPDAEQKLWQDFRKEALLFDQITITNNDLNNFPNLLSMLENKMGMLVDETEILDRLAIAVPNILNNAQNWTDIANYVAGLRARVYNLLENATTQTEIDSILENARTEAEMVATQYNLL